MEDTSKDAAAQQQDGKTAVEDGKRKGSACAKCRFYSLGVCLCCPFIFLGYIMTVALVLGNIVLTIQMLFFIFVDVVRNLSYIPCIVIFVVCIVVYVRKTGIKFSDRYRQLKNATFRVLLENFGLNNMTINREIQEGAFMKYPLQISQGGQIAMHQVVFDRIVDEVLPCWKCVVESLLQIFGILSLVAFFFWIIIDFQVSKQYYFFSRCLLYKMK